MIFLVLLHRPLVAEPGQDGTRRPQPEQAKCAILDPSPSSSAANSRSPFTPVRSKRPASSSPPARGHDRRSYRRAAQGIAAMIDTRGGLSAMACISAMQKCIRRGMEEAAMQFACELLFVATSLAQSKERYSSKIGAL
jgi:hypothetical protein